MSLRNIAPDEAPIAEAPAMADQEFDIVLKPLSHPDLGDIRIEDDLFAIGRTEPPFDSYAADIVADLSRRHARIFSEYGVVYVADLGSKNGTTVNDVNLQQKITTLRDGDEICFGGALSYRVQLCARAAKPMRAAMLISLTLTPERNDLGLEPIVITQFPFLISRADEIFSRYKNDYPHQVNYVSRRHAHIFLKNGSPFVEDLGGANGTFVAGKRLEEHAVPLSDGDVLAFGGHHFVYRVSLQKAEPELAPPPIDPTVTKISRPIRSAANSVGDADKTTFVGAADSFLDIFCIDKSTQQDEEINNEATQPPENTEKETEKRRKRSKFVIFLSELNTAFAGSDRASMKRALQWGASLVALLGILTTVPYFIRAPERELKGLLESGDYSRAAIVANQYLTQSPDNPELKALGVEALLKAYTLNWLALLKAREFDRAAAVLADMSKLAGVNAAALPLVSELEWMGDLENFVLGRGGVEAPIRIYSDEEKSWALLRRWEEDVQEHQRAFTAISSMVPAFKEPYAEALSHLRKLQSDDSVYLAAIERLKIAMNAELNRGNLAALEAVLKEYSEKYPRLDLESVRQDLRQYAELENETAARRLGPLIALLTKVQFSTPPFQDKFRALASSGRLPSADVIQQYQAVSKAWREGDIDQSFSDLQRMAAGPWADAASTELARKKAIAEQFATLQKSRDAKDYDERLLLFYGSLDLDEDIHFIKAIEADVGLYKDKALGRAQELLNKAQAQWGEYRKNGAIEGKQRLEGSISPQFRTQARLLSDAHEAARQGMLIYTQLKIDAPAEWRKAQEEINAEAELQRKSLQDLRTVLEPKLWKEKLALLGGHDNDK
jgi:pSer/pThr/pTyr-binding forkhead associated (FHA) protein